MKKLITCALFFISLLHSNAMASSPILYFSDITSGPATGIGDGLGSGAIVTVWGVNLGGSQGSSTISACGASPSYVYEWTNATQHTGHPSDLYTYHKMQVISFSLGATASGSSGIYVTVGRVSHVLLV